MDIFENAYSASLLDRKVRFSLRLFAGARAIKDAETGDLVPYGGGDDGIFHGSHRAYWTDADAGAVCDMLNKREAAATS